MSSLDLDLLRPADRALEITVGEQRLRFPIRGSLTVLEIVELLQLETRINAMGSGDSDEALVLSDVYAAVMRFVRERTPDAPDLPLNVAQLLSTLSFIAGDERSVDATVADAISPPAGDEEGQTDERAVAGPLGQPETRSQTPSSTSEPSTDGPPSGGVSAPGERSDSTSETLTPV